MRERLLQAGSMILAMVLLTMPGPSQVLKDNKKQGKSKQEARAESAAGLPAVLMQDRGDLATLDLYYGVGGKDGAPNPNDVYTFVDEDLNQSQPKFNVKDAEGRHWKAKLGAEPQSETAATRFVWAAGYFVDQDNYLDEIKVQDLPKLHRGEQWVSPGGTVSRVRLKLEPKEVKTIGYWAWSDNPFMRTRELNGLRVMMALIGNWDLITRNNKIYEVDGQRRYVVSDLGASFGRSGNEITRSKGKMEDYVASKFIDKTTSDTVDFAIHSRPLPLMALSFHYYPDLVHGQEVYKNVPRADARWIGQRLAQLSENQIRDCFRAAGYSPEEIEGYTKAVRQRIAELNTL